MKINNSADEKSHTIRLLHSGVTKFTKYQTIMTDRIENQVSMARTTDENLQKAVVVLSTIPALWANVQKYGQKVSVIEDMIQNQIKRIDGYAIDKHNTRKKLINYVMTASGMVRAYAADIENATLEQRVKITRSELVRSRDEEMYDASKIVIDTIGGLQAQMGPYGLNPVLLTNMQAALNNYHGLIEAPIGARNDRKYYTKQLAILVKDAIDFLKSKVDVHMELIALTHPDIVEKYRNARMVFDYRGGRRKQVIEDENAAFISGTVSDVDGFPVSDAKVIIENTGISTTTDADGEFLIDNVPAGKYNLIVSMEGYKETRENDFSVVAGDDVVKDFVMEVETTI